MGGVFSLSSHSKRLFHILSSNSCSLWGGIQVSFIAFWLVFPFYSQPAGPHIQECLSSYLCVSVPLTSSHFYGSALGSSQFMINPWPRDAGQGMRAGGAGQHRSILPSHQLGCGRTRGASCRVSLGTCCPGGSVCSIFHCFSALPLLYVTISLSLLYCLVHVHT